MFLDGFQRFSGRGKNGEARQMQARVKRLRESLPGHLEALFGDWIEPEKIHGRQGARERLYPAAVTFWAMLGQVLRGGSLRDAVVEMRASQGPSGEAPPAVNTSSYAEARARLPLRAIEEAHRRVHDKMIAPSPWLEGRRLIAVDGTSVQLPDTARNQEDFPQPSCQKPGCGFPVMQLVGLFDLDTAAVVEMARSPLYVDEAGLFETELMQHLGEGDILLGDRHFCSYFLYAKLSLQGTDTLCRLNHSRDWPEGVKGDDVTVRWTRPDTGQRPPHLEIEEWKALPGALTVRYVRFRISNPGYRTREVRLATTLLHLPLSELAKLYHARWGIELCFDDLKTTMEMEFVDAKSPAMAWKMVCMHLLAHNLIRSLMLQAARLPGAAAPKRLSFKGTLDTALRFAPALAAAGVRQLAQLHQRLLATIALDAVPYRPERIEPRLRKRRPKNHQLMTRPRAKWREEIIAKLNDDMRSMDALSE